MSKLSGRELSEKIVEELKGQYNKKLVIVTSDIDPASKRYIKNKVKTAEKCGLPTEVITMNINDDTEKYLSLIDELNADSDVAGVIIQLPLPKQIDVKLLQNKIDPDKDVDGFGALSKHDACTPSGIIALIDYNYGKEWLSGKNAVVIGRSEIVGKPMAKLLLDRNCTVTICHSKTKSIEDYTKKADLVVVATGVPCIINDDMLSDGAVVIDVGIHVSEEGKVFGDCHNLNRDRFDVSPVPGGVGPMTVISLIRNTISNIV